MSSYTTTYKQLIRSLVNHNKESKKKQLKKEIYKRLVKDIYQNKAKYGNNVKIPSVDEIEVNANDPRLYIIKDTKTIKEIFKEFVSFENGSESKTHAEMMTNVQDFLKNQAEYQVLLERYNPGIKLQNEYGSNDYNKKIVEKTAAKVGYKIPEYKTKEVNKE